MEKTAKVVLLGFLVLLVVLVGFVGYAVKEFLNPSEHVLLRWRDPAAGITFSVSERWVLPEIISKFHVGRESSQAFLLFNCLRSL